MTRPKTLEDYITWATSTLEHQYNETCETWYKMTAPYILGVWSDNFLKAGWREVLTGAAEEYMSEFGVSLFADEATPEVVLKTKPYPSVLDKLYRENVIWNPKFPEQPEKGWCAPDDVFSRFNDIIRTRIVLRYLDGPEYLAKKISVFAQSLGFQCDFESRESDEGYYGFHVYITTQTDIPDRSYSNRASSSKLEIQLTTQLQDVLRDLTHKFYEERRLQHQPDRKAWKWAHKSNHFRSAYIAHTLHLLEGIILDVRDGNKEPI